MTAIKHYVKKTAVYHVTTTVAEEAIKHAASHVVLNGQAMTHADFNQYVACLVAAKDEIAAISV